MVKNLLIIHVNGWCNQTQYLYDLDLVNIIVDERKK